MNPFKYLKDYYYHHHRYHYYHLLYMSLYFYKSPRPSEIIITIKKCVHKKKENLTSKKNIGYIKIHFWHSGTIKRNPTGYKVNNSKLPLNSAVAIHKNFVYICI